MNEEEIKIAGTQYSKAMSEEEIKEKLNSYHKDIKSGIDPYINYRNQQLDNEYLQHKNPFINDAFKDALVNSKLDTPIESYRAVFIDNNQPGVSNNTFNIKFADNPAFNIKNEEIEKAELPIGSAAWYNERQKEIIKKADLIRAEKAAQKALNNQYLGEMLQTSGNGLYDQVKAAKIGYQPMTKTAVYQAPHNNMPQPVGEGYIHRDDFDLEDLPDFVFEDEEGKLENEVEEQPKIMKKDYQYRVILSHNKMKINYIQCPIDYKGSDADLLMTAQTGSNRDIRLINYIPKFDKSGKEIMPPKKKGKYAPPLRQPPGLNRNTIPISQFIEKTNNVFTKEVTFADYSRARYVSRMSKRQFNTHIANGELPANILVYDPIFNQYAITTGKVTDNMFIEVIVIANMNGANGYTEKSHFRLEELNSGVIDVVADDRVLMRFFRAKPGNSIKSRSLYGGSIAERKRLDGKILGDDRVSIRENFVIEVDKPGNTVLQIVNDTRDAYIYTLVEESKLFTVNTDQLQKLKNKVIRKVEKNKQAIIKDDRRLKGLKKGDVVLVEAILTKPSKSLSLATIVANGKRQTIFLKQLKPYAEIDKKTVKKESKPSGIIDVSKTSGSLYNESSKETASEIKPKAVVKKRAAKAASINETIGSYLFPSKDKSNIVELPF